MIVTERHQRALDFVLKHLRRVKPGQRITIAFSVLNDIEGMRHNGYSWNPADRVLENVMGSSYEWRYHPFHYGGDVTFERLSGPVADGYQSYVSPDRRHLFIDVGGLWMRKTSNQMREFNDGR